jgi:hypothetical protein
MRLNGSRRFWVAVAILPLIGGVALASGSAMFGCRGGMVARMTCCPDQRAPDVLSQAVPNVSAGCCCEASQANAPVALVAEPRVAPDSVDHRAAAPFAGVAFASSLASVRAWPTAADAQPPPAAIPILLAKQAFLM